MLDTILLSTYALKRVPVSQFLVNSQLYSQARNIALLSIIYNGHSYHLDFTYSNTDIYRSKDGMLFYVWQDETAKI